MRRNCAALGLVAFALVACGVERVPIEELNARHLDAECQWLVRCGGFDTMARCLDQHVLGDYFFESLPSPSVVTPSIIAAVNNGKLTYDGVQAIDCLDTIAARSCDGFDLTRRVDPVVCVGVFRGHAKNGDDCALAEECGSRSCTTDFGCPVSGCCAKVCSSGGGQGGVGSECLGTMECAPIAWCDGQRCQALLPAGAACFGNAACEFGYACLGGTCRTPPAAGDPCYEDEAGNFFCSWDFLACNQNTMTCEPLSPENGACGQWGPYCMARLTCSTTGVCIPEHLPALDEACLAVCDRGLYCSFELKGGSGVCRALLDDGAPCGGDQMCKSGHCDGFTAACAAPAVCF